MKRILIVGVILLISVITTSVASGAMKVRFSADEQRLLDSAYKAGGYPLQAILLNESVAGRYGNHGDKQFKDWKRQCYGIYQVQYLTAVYIIKKYRLDNQDIRWRLQYDNAFNLKVASTYLKHLLKMFKGNVELSILAYNTGPGNVKRHGISFDPNGYRIKALRWIAYLKAQTKAEESEIRYHTIRRGDTLSLIAKHKLGSWRKWKSILALNKGIDVMRLQIGMKIRIK